MKVLLLVVLALFAYLAFQAGRQSAGGPPLAGPAVSLPALPELPFPPSPTPAAEIDLASRPPAPRPAAWASEPAVRALASPPVVAPPLRVSAADLAAGQVTVITHEPGQRVETVLPIEQGPEGPYIDTSLGRPRFRVIGADDPPAPEPRRLSPQERACAEQVASRHFTPLACH